MCVTTGRWGGRAGQRGAFGRKGEKEGERDECFMGIYHAAKDIPLLSRNGVCVSIMVKQIFMHLCLLLNFLSFIENLLQKHTCAEKTSYCTLLVLLKKIF